MLRPPRRAMLSRTVMRNPQLTKARKRDKSENRPFQQAAGTETERQETRRGDGGRTPKAGHAGSQPLARRSADDFRQAHAPSRPLSTAAPVSSRVWPRQPCCWAAHFGLSSRVDNTQPVENAARAQP